MRPEARGRLSFAWACLGLMASASAGAAEPWLSASGSPRCAPKVERLAARVERAVVGELGPGLRATVVLRDTRRGTSATVSLAQRERSLGSRQLVAGSCEEALDAVVAVTALALSSTARASEAPAAEVEISAEVPATEAEVAVEALEPLRVEQSPARSAREPVMSADGGARGAEGRSAAPALLLSTGADLRGGTRALLSLGAALRAGAGEWRAKLWYALPTLSDEEEAVPQRSLQARSERGALALDYCRDAGVLDWLAVCGGLELGAARHWRAETLAGQPRRERRWLEPGLAAALGSRLTHPDWHWQPGLELTLLLPLVDSARDQRIGLRAQAGVAVPF